MSNKKVMMIGIMFHDNDFYNTIQPFLKVLGNAFDEDGLPSTMNKKHIVDAFNEMAYGLYLLNQHQNRYPLHGNTKEYLKIEEKDVYLDSEIQALLDKDPWYNCEFHYYDHYTKSQYCI